MPSIDAAGGIGVLNLAVLVRADDGCWQHGDYPFVYPPCRLSVTHEGIEFFLLGRDLVIGDPQLLMRRLQLGQDHRRVMSILLVVAEVLQAKTQTANIAGKPRRVRKPTIQAFHAPLILWSRNRTAGTSSTV